MARNTNKKNILVVTGTRAEYGLLRPVMDAIRAHPQLLLSVLATGMHTLKSHGLTMREVRATYDSHIVSIREGSTMLEALVQEIKGIANYCRKATPHGIVVLGDRDEPLAAALVASHLNIPLAHIHGGDISGPGVDESNRHVITKLAHLHFPATELSARRIKHLGEDEWRITVAGTPGLDSLSAPHSRDKIAKKLKLDARKSWLLFVQHPTAFDTTMLQKQIQVGLSALSRFSSYEKIIIYPNNDTGSDIFISHIKQIQGDGYHTFVSLPREEYVSLLKESEVIIGNSSSGIIEANFLGTPTVDIGNRQRGRERGDGVINVPYDSVKIVAAIKRAVAKKKRARGSIPSPYGSGNAGDVIAKKIALLIGHPRLLRKK